MRNTEMLKETLAAENESIVGISLRTSQYKMLKQVLAWAAYGLEEDRPTLDEIKELAKELDRELVYREKS